MNPMKLFKRLLSIIIIVLVLLLASAVAIPIIYKKDIVRLIKSDLSSAVDARVVFDEDISIKILPSFPNLSLEINDIHIVGIESFNLDTLLSCKRLKAVISLKKLFQDKAVDLRYLEFNNPIVRLLSNDTLNNWDIYTSASNSTSDIELSADFDKILIQNGFFSYLESNTSTHVALSGITGSFNGRYNQDTFDLTSLFDCTDAYISYNNIAYVNHIPIQTEATTSIDLNTSAYAFKENQLRAGSIAFEASGGLKFVGDSTLIEIQYASNDADFKDLLSLVPSNYTNDLKDYTATGNAKVSGTVSGVISETQTPGYAVDLRLTEGNLSHKELPGDMQKVSLDLNVSNVDGQDKNLTIDLKRLGFKFQGNPFTAALFMGDIYRDPHLNGKINGTLDLDKLNVLLPNTLETRIGGLITCDLSLNGRMSSIASNEIQKMNSSGSILAKNVSYKNAQSPNPIVVRHGQLTFNENEINIPVFDVAAGKSDMMITGQVQNAIGYLMNHQALKGAVTISSKILDVGDFIDVSATDSSNLEPLELPDDMNLDVVYKIDDFQYTNHSFAQVQGSAQLNDKTLDIRQLSTDCLDGQVILSGNLNSTNINNPLADLNLIVQNLNIQKAFANFETLRKIIPLVDNITGKFSSTFRIKTELLRDLSPNLSDITCQGILDLFDCDLEGM
ncbi:MAG: hypothetical protein ACI9JN_002096, partial [Bacteroidia bacterium]